MLNRLKNGREKRRRGLALYKNKRGRRGDEERRTSLLLEQHDEQKREKQAGGFTLYFICCSSSEQFYCLDRYAFYMLTQYTSLHSRLLLFSPFSSSCLVCFSCCYAVMLIHGNWNKVSKHFLQMNLDDLLDDDELPSLFQDTGWVIKYIKFLSQFCI